jgi:hypothetical protein
MQFNISNRYCIWLLYSHMVHLIIQYNDKQAVQHTLDRLGSITNIIAIYMAFLLHVYAKNPILTQLYPYIPSSKY